ncbi:hypothetical protein Asppvi_002033 [Aspergillus pseudoviridinutans]|uniref:HMG box domain-containing protein n=1 Tax=Aspergillus pseudoviridinutans TaxID=1517512 RepID=A0A9P3EY41_9EURO|nr:uncharacterized protein Asppvi_002001 [Aspergillus pseudoviridinutans]XP_043163470.1 uncharacterized protein Asppvi_002002 [Aspergillus pseudoviridinutans]XP_043163501.1 uncharacterized protein Asppvi_002033 [Aspergillus pseudoviridinutans]GIJ92723.1 hypothetical protein Asppvi_002001 [Aspergillus pseudoviridinutans]GIJ92724.1 hypothetical protein Asppvi_002002 [Aspergillus pseudoviridinutans]GIJ92755.1 hypothetical protein Asppvi_002033 [Aspergillus pseudoviridinutans]
MKGSSITHDNCANVDLTNQWPLCAQRTYARQSAFDSVGTASGAHTKNEGFDLPGPLSELTQTMTHIPVRDMHSWVQRPIEERRQEILKKNGRIPRPMNSFMLYRSAYADRAKFLTTAHNDHQKVSIITGISWNIETPKIRRTYKILARIEKENHARAHPDYHFSASKKRKPSLARTHSKKKARSSAQLLPKLCQASDSIQPSALLDDAEANGCMTRYRVAEHGLPVESSSYWAESLQRPHIGDSAGCDWPSYSPKVWFGQEPTQSSMVNMWLGLASWEDIQPSLTTVSGQRRMANSGHLPPRSSASGSELADIQSNSDSLSVRYATSPDTVHRSELHDCDVLDYGQDVGW